MVPETLMRPVPRLGLLFALLVVPTLSAPAQDWRDQIRSAIEKSTLNQQGTPPFHLRAELSPYRSGIEPAYLKGTIEIWWMSATQWKREIQTEQFHQIAIMSDGKEWQHNDGDYLPEWLREITDDLLNPVPNLDKVLDESGGARSWQSFSTDGTVKKSVGCGLSIQGVLTFGTCTGWGGEFSDFREFGNRIIARTINAGEPQATARITVLENLDLSNVSFAPPPDMTSSPLIQTVVLDEISLRKNLQSSPPPQWPAVEDGPFDGLLTTTYVLVDRNGTVRDVGMMLSDNPRLDDAAKKFIAGLHFKPFVVNGEPVQVVSRLTMPFKTVRPAGLEAFDSARNYFEIGRKTNSPAFSGAKPYAIHATVKIYGQTGMVQGDYTDTWKANNEWKREVKIGQSYMARSQDGGKYYRLINRADLNLPASLKSAAAANFTIAGFVLDAIEPIPPTDNFYEADWRIHRDKLADVNSIRVLRGYEPLNGTCDPENTYAFWFDPAGRLIRFCERVDVRYSDFRSFNGAQVPQDIRVLEKGKTVLSIQIDEMRSLDPNISNETFVLPSTPNTRSFTTAIEAR